MSNMSMAASTAVPVSDAPLAPHLRAEAPAAPREIAIDELEIRHLQGPGDIARVLHLRQEIHLPAAALADPGFESREKKETSTALSPDSSGAAPGLEPFVLFRSGSASHPARSCW
ncbi:hypothetical protein PE066_00150 [Ramlibacter tataouinensis]|uniref:hypothetical protein n=1 Tax=Ramlibacter tataouinensis TaxID=94132 RepID=UPI0022F3E325|nr:hypothetical protein [Ramlibacter tataouinensis]WBY01989.1 hypothetical protein PE066_00150 [Ramlibacter tataouinensis]